MSRVVADKDRNEPRSLRTERPRGRIDGVAELPRSGLNALARPHADVVLVVERARHRGDRHACFARDVANRGSRAHLVDDNATWRRAAVSVFATPRPWSG